MKVSLVRRLGEVKVWQISVYSYFITERRLRSLRKAKEDNIVSIEDNFIKDSNHRLVVGPRIVFCVFIYNFYY